jgi:hypothetical protein
MNVDMFWDTVPSSPSVKPHFGGTYHHHLQDRKSSEQETSVERQIFNPEDGADTFLRNVNLYTIYTALYP